MSDLPEADRQFLESLAACAESARRAAGSLYRVALMMNPELREWDDEMTNCYPHWPD